MFSAVHTDQPAAVTETDSVSDQVLESYTNLFESENTDIEDDDAIMQAFIAASLVATEVSLNSQKKAAVSVGFLSNKCT